VNKPPAGSPKSPSEHMAKRRGQGATYREIADEHGCAKSTAHRKATKELAQGFVKMGSAK
jgi:DNA-binding IclR family transcriptional regulator